MVPPIMIPKLNFPSSRLITSSETSTWSWNFRLKSWRNLDSPKVCNSVNLLPPTALFLCHLKLTLAVLCNIFPLWLVLCFQVHVVCSLSAAVGCLRQQWMVPFCFSEGTAQTSFQALNSTFWGKSTAPLKARCGTFTGLYRHKMEQKYILMI